MLSMGAGNEHKQMCVDCKDKKKEYTLNYLKTQGW